jgi:hypothetical protein
MMDYGQDGVWEAGGGFLHHDWNIERVLRLQRRLLYPTLFPGTDLDPQPRSNECVTCRYPGCIHSVYRHRWQKHNRAYVKESPFSTTRFERAYACAFESINHEALLEIFDSAATLYRRIWADHRLFGEMTIRARVVKEDDHDGGASQLGFPDLLSVSLVLGRQARRKPPTVHEETFPNVISPLDRNILVVATFGSVLTNEEHEQMARNWADNAISYRQVRSRIGQAVDAGKFCLPTMEQVMQHCTPPTRTVHATSAPRVEPGRIAEY